ncbi:MAG TPA: hypothetical protein VMT56_03415 [Candidatus Bathyarchaeia archaeon]|nr:hypothetical protein [Candidatus Bathyarchaeia archaeon]
MASKRKEIHLRHKVYFEQKLKDRLKSLSVKGVEPAKADKDPLVRNLKAEIRTVNRRMRVIAAQEKLAEELVKRKAARAAAPAKEEEGGKPEKSKKGPAEAKEKKPKGEKKPAAPKPAEARPSQPPAAAPEEGKAAPKK